MLRQSLKFSPVKQYCWAVISPRLLLLPAKCSQLDGPHSIQWFNERIEDVTRVTLKEIFSERGKADEAAAVLDQHLVGTSRVMVAILHKLGKAFARRYNDHKERDNFLLGIHGP